MAQQFRTLASLWVVFFVNGAVLSSWAPRIPAIKAGLGLSDSQLGFALFGIAAGSVPALAVTAKVLTVVKDTHLCLVSATVFSAALPLLAAAENLTQLTTALVILGAASGTLDVAMNAAAIRLQTACGVPVLSRLHGGYSLGVLGGASGGVAATGVDASVSTHFLLTAGLLITVVVVVAPGLVRQAGPALRKAPVDRDAPTPDRARLPILVAVLAVSCLLVEGLVTDWSALLVSRDFGAEATNGAITLVIFTFAMFVSRSGGDALVRRFGEEPFLMRAAVVMPVPVVIATLAQSVPLMFAAVAVAGLLLGPIFPIAVSRASRDNPRQAASLTAKVSFYGYTAYLAGPPLIGLVADAFTLTVTFPLVIALSCLGIWLAARNTTRALRP